MREIMNQVDIDGTVAQTIAAAMREVAQADGNHPAEELIIDAFEAELPEGPHAVDLSVINTPELAEAFVKSLLLVAFADGAISDAEDQVINNYAVALGLSSIQLRRAISDVASAMLSSFAGVKLYKDQVVTLGKQLGLDHATVEQILT